MLQDNPDVKQGVSSDEDIKLKVQLTQFALRKLDIVVDEFWAEISDSIQIIEVSPSCQNCRLQFHCTSPGGVRGQDVPG